jgi:ribosome maturation factor RimP
LKAQRKKRNKHKKQASGKDAFSPKRSEAIISRTKELAEPLCEAEGFELVHVEYQRETGGRVLRLYVDKPGGITLDDCVYISRQTSDLLDVNLESDEAYSLEVTSPGLNRPLAKEADFERFQGNVAEIRVRPPLSGRKNFKGVLLGISGGYVNLLLDKETVAIPFDAIVKARLVNYNGENG